MNLESLKYILPNCSSQKPNLIESEVPSPCINQIPAKLLQAGNKKLHSDIHKLFGIRKNYINVTNQLLSIFIKKTEVIFEYFLFCQLHTILSNIFLAWLTPFVNEISDHQNGFYHNRPTTD
jgi:hypothetical protein